jgi:hypothetical protein
VLPFCLCCRSAVLLFCCSACAAVLPIALVLPLTLAMLVLLTVLVMLFCRQCCAAGDAGAACDADDAASKTA